jgi:predicted 3-demethylubiquinone-9 3-methyltransferase (glyoxalase superfamily)
MQIAQKISTHLWFDRNAEAAIEFYCSLFPGSRVTGKLYYGKDAMGPEGTVMSVIFELCGQEFMAVNGGPHYRMSPAISLFVKCDTQAEIDRLWEKLIDGGGEALACGWVTDRFGVTWQIVPVQLYAMASDRDAAKAQRVMAALMQMVKIDLPTLQRAYEGA